MAPQFTSEEVMYTVAMRIDYKRHKFKQATYDASNVRLSALQCTATSSLGPFENLPPELIWDIGDLLDFQSLSRLSRVCVKAKKWVESISAYKAMMEHAPMALAGLSRSGFLRSYSAGSLYKLLRAGECACGNFAPFLHLPTHQRACISCQASNQKFWMIDETKARQVFELPRSYISDLPKMRPLHYAVPPLLREQRAALESAMNIALQRGGVADREFAQRTEAYIRGTESDQLVNVQHLTELSEMVRGPMFADLGLDIRRDHEQHWYRMLQISCKDPEHGLGSVHFPVLAKYGVEEGFWCRGCVREDAGIFNTTFTRTEIMKHIEKCEEARELLVVVRLLTEA